MASLFHSRYLLLLELAALAIFLADASATSGSSKTVYRYGNQCCVDCLYVSGCCCAKRNGLPVTKTVKVTKWSTKTVSAAGVPKRGKPGLLARRRVEAGISLFDEPNVEVAPMTLEEISNFDDEVTAMGRRVSTSARHLCPVCPAGATILPASFSKNNNGNNKFCCPKRKTVTKTRIVRKTKTKTKAPTPTIVQTGTVNGNVIRVDGNAQPNSLIKLYVQLVAKQRRLAARAFTYVGQGNSNSQGNFTVYSKPLPVGIYDGQITQTGSNQVESAPIPVGTFPIIKPGTQTTMQGGATTVVGAQTPGSQTTTAGPGAGTTVGPAGTTAASQKTTTAGAQQPSGSAAGAMSTTVGQQAGQTTASGQTTVPGQTTVAGQSTTGGPVGTTINTAPAGVTTTIQGPGTTTPLATSTPAETTTELTTTTTTETETNTRTTSTPATFTQRAHLPTNTGADDINWIATDQNNNVYFVGNYDSQYLTVGDVTITNSGVTADFRFTDIVVGSFDVGLNLRWMFTLGGDGNDNPTGLDCDPDGNCVLAAKIAYEEEGVTTPHIGSTEIPTGTVIIKLDSSGNLIWFKDLSAVESDKQGFVVHVHPYTGAVYLAGSMGSASATIDTVSLTADGGNPWPLYMILDGTTGAATAGMVFSLDTGSANYRGRGTAITFSNDTNAVYIGGTYGAQMYVGASTLAHPNAGTSASFVVKVDGSGNPQWVMNYDDGGGGGVNSLSLSSDESDIFAGGYFTGTTTGGVTLTATSPNDGYYLMLQTSDGAALWGNNIGENAYVNYVGYSPAGDLYVGGQVQTTSGTAHFGSTTFGVTNTINGFVGRVFPNGTEAELYAWSGDSGIYGDCRVKNLAFQSGGGGGVFVGASGRFNFTFKDNLYTPADYDLFVASLESTL